MHFSASSQWNKICFWYQGIIFNGKKVLKFSQIEAVRLGGGGGDPPSHQGVSLTAFSQFFFMTSLKHTVKFYPSGENFTQFYLNELGT